MNLRSSQPKHKTDILVVDDQAMVLTSMVAVLETGGYAAHGVTNAEDALDFVREHRPRVLLMDVQLGSSNGVELAKQIADEIPDIRVILLTGDPDFNAVTDATKGDGLRFEVMAKPVRPQRLFALLSAAS
jgi:DNA-binding NtrC family response regulator